MWERKSQSWIWFYILFCEITFAPQFCLSIAIAANSKKCKTITIWKCIDHNMREFSSSNNFWQTLCVCWKNKQKRKQHKSSFGNYFVLFHHHILLLHFLCKLVAERLFGKIAKKFNKCWIFVEHRSVRPFILCTSFCAYTQFFLLFYAFH